MTLNTLLIIPKLPTTAVSCSTHSCSTATCRKSPLKILLLSHPASSALASSPTSPSLAIPFLNSQTSSSLSSIAPSSQSQNLQIGLDVGKIQPCPSTNPACVSTNPKSSSFGFAWVIPENKLENAFQKLQNAIMRTEKLEKIQAVEDTPDGLFLWFWKIIWVVCFLGDEVRWQTSDSSGSYGVPSPRNLHLRSKLSLVRTHCAPLQVEHCSNSQDVRIMCEPCNGKGWLVCDFCNGQKTNVKAENNRIYRRCPSCRAIGYVLCSKCKVFKCVTFPDYNDGEL